MTIDDLEAETAADEMAPDEVEADTEAATEESSNPHQTKVDELLLQRILEGALLAAGQPLTVARLLELFDESVAPSKEEILTALQAIQQANSERGFELKEVASGWRFQVCEGLAPWVNRLWDEKPQKYSRALLETLALIAYRQPITRGDIEEIRGVAVSSHIMKTLMERDWVKVVGQRDVPGRPSLYATTRQFLDYFNLKNLDELPSLGEIRDLDELNAALNLGLDEDVLDTDETDSESAVDSLDAEAPVDSDELVDSEDSELVDSEDTEVLDNELVDPENAESDSAVLPADGEEIQLEEFVDGEDAFEDFEDASQEFSQELSPELSQDSEADLTDDLYTDENNGGNHTVDEDEEFRSE